MKNKTMATHIDRINKGRFEKSEINAMTKLWASYRFANYERKSDIQTLKGFFFHEVDVLSHYRHGSSFWSHIFHFNTGDKKISKEQTDFGKRWLKNFYFKKNGEPRKRAEEVPYKVLDIAKAVTRFEFIGVLDVRNQYSESTTVQAMPIYRAYNKKGEYFDYSPVHWSDPVIMTGY